MAYNTVETVRVQREGFEKGVLINKSDLDQKSDKLFDDAAREADLKAAQQVLADAKANLDKLTKDSAPQAQIDAATATLADAQKTVKALTPAAAAK